MKTSNDFRYILVTRKTRLQELVERFNTWPQARFYLEHNQVDAGDYLSEHDLYRKRSLQAEELLKSRGRFQLLERRFLPSYQFGPRDIVVVIGQDGLVANTMKYLEGQPVIGVNPDPARWDGKLLRFGIDNLAEVIDRTESRDVDIREVTFAEAQTNDGQRLLAINDLFIGPKSHTSARYQIQWGGKTELQSSSGIIVSTGFGSTGWFQSILYGALGVTGQAEHSMQPGFPWDAQKLQFTVREPFPSNTTGTELVFGEVNLQQPLKLESHMPENGVIFSDGIEQDYLQFNSGSIVTIGIAERKGRVVVD